jgi:hypothetical protein
VSVIVTLNHLSHAFDFIRGQASRDDSWAAWLVIEITSGLGAAPTVVAGRRETRDSKCRAERQDSLCPLDRSQENPLGVTLWKPLVIELDLRVLQAFVWIDWRESG